MIPVATLALAGWGILLFIAERLFPAVPAPFDARRLGRNLAMGLIVLTVSPLIQWATLSAMDGAQPLFQTNSALLHILILDVWAYALHRAYHRVPLMWRLHAPHHFDQHLDVTSAVRFHIGEVLLSSILRLIPLFALGISLETNLLYGAILSGAAMFHHSNLRLPGGLERPLSRVIVTPSIHWVHHHAVRADTDSNYASILSIWDHMFRSASRTVQTVNKPIGVEGEEERTLAKLLVYPALPATKP